MLSTYIFMLEKPIRITFLTSVIGFPRQDGKCVSIMPHRCVRGLGIKLSDYAKLSKYSLCQSLKKIQ
jgi:hypothetical protein